MHSFQGTMPTGLLWDFLKTWHCLKINANGKQGICNVKDHVNFVWLYPSMYGTVFIFYHQSVFLVTLHLVQWDMINQLCPVGIRLTSFCNFHIFDIRSRSFARHGGGGGISLYSISNTIILQSFDPFIFFSLIDMCKLYQLKTYM